MDKKTIIIGADLVPNKHNEKIFERGLAEEIVGHQLNKELESCDVRIFNLETVIYDGDSPIQKCGPCLKTPTAVMPGIKSLNPTIVTLANNHAMDHGVDGLKSTISQLNKYEIDYLGAGESLSHASRPYFVELDGVKVSIYACVEHEFSVVSEKVGGLL